MACTDACSEAHTYERGCELTLLDTETEKIDERIELPEEMFTLLHEAVNNLYGKACTEGTELMDWDGPVAVKREIRAKQEIRISHIGLLMQWVRQGFKLEETG